MFWAAEPLPLAVEKLPGEKETRLEFDWTCTVTASDGRALKVKDRKSTTLREEGIDAAERLTVRVLQQVVLITCAVRRTSPIFETANCLDTKQKTLYSVSGTRPAIVRDDTLNPSLPDEYFKTEILSRECRTKEEGNAAQLIKPLPLNLDHTDMEFEPLWTRIIKIEGTT